MSDTTNSTTNAENCGTHTVAPPSDGLSSPISDPRTVVELFAATRRSAWAVASALDTFSGNILKLESLLSQVGRNDASDPLV